VNRHYKYNIRSEIDIYVFFCNIFCVQVATANVTSAATSGKFLDYMKQVRREQTAYQYHYAVERFLRWLRGEGIADVAQASSNVLSDYCSTLLADGNSPSTVNVQVAAVRRYARWLRQQGVEVPELHAPEKLRVVRRVREVLNDVDLQAYLEAAEDRLGEPTRTAAKLLPYTGLRSGEVVVLSYHCLKRVPVKFKNGKREVYCLKVEGKGGHQRVVPLLEGIEVLHEYLGWRKKLSDKRWLFPGRQKGHMAGHTLRVAVAGLRGEGQEFTPHTFRRTYLTNLYKKGVDPIVIAKIAGHADVGTLMRHYLAIGEDEVVAAVGKAQGET